MANFNGLIIKEIIFMYNIITDTGVITTVTTE